MIEKFRTGTLHGPTAAATQLTGNGAAVNITNAQDVIVVAEVDKGDGAALTFTPQRADAAGTWSAIPNNAKIYVAVDTGTADTLVRQADGVAYATGAVNTDHRVVMRIDPDSLGLSAAGNPITQVRVVISGGHANDRGVVTAYIVPRYKP